MPEVTKKVPAEYGRHAEPTQDLVGTGLLREWTTQDHQIRPHVSMRSDATLIVWFRNDLRLHDNALFVEAAKAKQVIPLFVFDPRFLHELSEQVGVARAGSLRSTFLEESVDELKRSLYMVGSDLVVRTGSPEHVISALALQALERGASAVTVTYHVEDTHEEQVVELALTDALSALPMGSTVDVNPQRGGISLFHPDDLNFPQPPVHWQAFSSHIKNARVRRE